MKFGRYLREIMETLPSKLANATLSYKKWKKRSKVIKDISTNLAKLGRECNKVNTIFLTETKLYLSGRRGCFHNFISPSDILQFAQVNKTAMYKICKRLDKRGLTYGAMQWYNKIVGDRSFDFIGGFWLERLRIEVNRRSIDPCPVCFQEFDAKSTFVFSNCCHMICWDCFITHAKIKGKRGTVNNVLQSYCPNVLCPMCRSSNAYFNIRKFNIIPSTNSYLLEEIVHTS
jgi:hypothetical protein